MIFLNQNDSGVIGSALIQLLSILTFYGSQLGTKDPYPVDFGPKLAKTDGQTFDIIIVGAGSAGCVLANRLSEVNDWKVLVLEAGTIPSIDVEVPVFYNRIVNSDEDWNFKTVKENHLCHGTSDKKCSVHAGKMLGGSSGLSNMHYERVKPKFFNDWNVLPYDVAKVHYKNIENYIGEKKNVQGFGIGGELPIQRINTTHPVTDLIYTAAKLGGYKRVTNAELELGYYDVNGYIHEGSRQNFAKAFFERVKDRKNLFVAQKAMVSRVVTKDPIDNRAVGVDVIVEGREVFVNAKLEVILTGGAINSAQLLILSGIGPADIIKSFRMPVIKDLPIGKNYKDQVGVPVFIELPATDNQDGTDFADATYHYLKDKSGPYTRININGLVASINTEHVPFPDANIKIQHYFYEPDDSHFKRLIENYGYKKEIAESILERNAEVGVLVIFPILTNPVSTGQVLVKSTNPFTRPTIKGNYLGDDTLQDLNTLITSLRYVQSLIDSEPFQRMQAKPIYPNIPNCRNYHYCTDQYWRCYVENLGMPMSQGVGTIRAGNLTEDCGMCIDTEFLVKDIRHLRVVDGSVFPNCVSGSLESAVAMLADKVASDVRESWGK